MSLKMKSKRIIRIIVAGAPQVGKTSFLNQIIRVPFKTQYKPTQEVQFQTRYQTIQNIKLTLNFFELARQQRYHNFFRPYCIKNNFYIFMFDLTNVDSYQTAKRLIQKTFKDSDKKQRCFLIGNKSDLMRQIPVIEQGIEYRQMNCKDQNTKVIDQISEIIAKSHFRQFQKQLIYQSQFEQKAKVQKKRNTVIIGIIIILILTLIKFQVFSSSNLQKDQQNITTLLNQTNSSNIDTINSSSIVEESLIKSFGQF